MRQILVGEELEQHVGRRVRKDQEQRRPMGLYTQVKYRIRQFLVGEGLEERHVGSNTRKDQEQRRPMGLYTQVPHCWCRCRQPASCSALVSSLSSRWSVLAPTACDTITSITRRRQEGPIEPGLGISAGGTKPVLYDAIITFW